MFTDTGHESSDNKLKLKIKKNELKVIVEINQEEQTVLSSTVFPFSWQILKFNSH